MRYLFFIVISFICLITGSAAHAQIKESNYLIISTPIGATDADIARLNIQIAKDSDETVVHRKIDHALKKLTGKTVRIRSVPIEGKALLSYYSIGGLEQTKRNINTFTVGLGADELITNDDALKKYLTDTLYVIDTLQISTLTAPAFDPAAYILKDLSDSVPSIALGFRNNGISIYPLTKSRGQFISCSLQQSDPAYAPFRFNIMFIDEERMQFLKDNRALLNFVNGGKIEPADNSLVADVLSQYFKLKYGEIKPGNILDWLNRK